MIQINGKEITISRTDFFGDDEACNSIMNMLYEESIYNWIRFNRPPNTKVSYLVKADNKPIGFVLLCKEGLCEKSLFMYAGLIKEYQGKGLSRLLYEYVLNDYNERFIVGAIHKNNINSSKAIQPYGEYLFDDEDYDVYLLHNGIYQSFNQYGKEELERHYGIDNNENARTGVIKQ